MGDHQAHGFLGLQICRECVLGPLGLHEEESDRPIKINECDTSISPGVEKEWIPEQGPQDSDNIQKAPFHCEASEARIETLEDRGRRLYLQAVD